MAGREAARFALGQLPAPLGEVACQPGENLRYVCPQTIALTREDAPQRLFFRVAAPAKNSVIRASCNGQTVYEKKAGRVNPGEMESIQVDRGALSPGRLVIDVRQEA